MQYGRGGQCRLGRNRVVTDMADITADGGPRSKLLGNRGGPGAR